MGDVLLFGRKATNHESAMLDKMAGKKKAKPNNDEKTPSKIEKYLVELSRFGGQGSAYTREQIFKRHIFFAGPLKERYEQNAIKHGVIVADEYLKNMDRLLFIKETGLKADSSDEDIRIFSVEIAAKIRAYLFRFSDAVYEGHTVNGGMLPYDAAIEFLEGISQETGVKIPIDIKPKDKPDEIKKKWEAAALRMCCDRFWRRQMRKIVGRRLEHVCRLLGLVSAKRGKYCSDFTCSRRKSQRKRNNDLLENMIAENETGFSATLAELAEHSQANPWCRKTELIVRAKGYEEIAKKLGYRALFFTLTCPSKYHAVLNKSGDFNPKYNRSTPRDAQEYLNGVWARIRAEWQRQGVRTFGFRIAEPHHDGTPHWHLLLFVPRPKRKKLVEIFRKHATAEDKEEIKGRENVRFDVKYLHDNDGGSVVGYIIKYIGKNIDGERSGKAQRGKSLGEDKEAGGDLKDNAPRVDAWAGVWGIRQFQQIGAVSVTVWRELRRGVNLELFEAKSDEDIENLKAIAEAADKSDWSRFCELMGGVLVRRDSQLLRPFYRLALEANDYGELSPEIRGVIMRGVSRLITRYMRWVVSKKPIGWQSQPEAKGGDSPPLDLCQ